MAETRLEVDPDFLSMSREELLKLPPVGSAPAVAPAAPASPEAPDFLSMPREDLLKLPPLRSQSPSVFTDPVGAFKAAMPANVTALVRGIGGLADAIPDPLSPIRRMILPDVERVEKSGEIYPGKLAGDAFFGATGIPEYVPKTPGERVKMSAAQGAVGGAPFGPFAALLGMLGGGAGQTITEATATPENPYGNERLATAAGLLPSVLAQGGAIPMAAARTRAQTRLTPDLYEAGVRPTIGQLIGGTLGRLEEGFGSIPWVGDFVRAGRRGAQEQFNRGPVEQTLERIGQPPLNPDTPTGRGTISEGQQALGRAYDAIEPRLGLTLDSQFVGTDLPRVLANAGRLTPDNQRAFNNALQTHLLGQLQPGGTLTGAGWRLAESEIGREANNFAHAVSGHERQLGRTLYDLQNALRDLQTRANPQVAPELSRLHDAYADFQRLQNAAARLGTDNGVFSPNQLLSAVRSGDPSLGHRRFAAGDARMQDYAQNAATLLSNKVPDSGTPFRSMAAMLPFAGGAGVLSPAAAAGVVGAGLGAGWLYSPRGRAAVTDFLLRDPTGAPLILPGLLSSQDPYLRP